MLDRIRQWVDGDEARDGALLVLRSVLAAVFIFHGSQKLFGWFGGYGLEATATWMGGLGIPFPLVSAFLAGATELLGGVALVSGIAARLATLPLGFTMLVAMVTAHSGFDAGAGGIEYPLTLAAVLLVLGVLGPGRWRLPIRFRPSGHTLALGARAS